MRRLTAILCLALIAAFLISLTGCNPAPVSTQPTQPSASTAPTDPPTQPATEPTEPAPEITDIRQLTSTVYATNVYTDDGRLDTPTPIALDVSITWYDDGQSSVSLCLGSGESTSFDFQDPKNSFTLQQTDPALPYYYAIGDVYQPFLDGYSPFEFVIDFEKEYVIFRTRTIPVVSYTVASTDPAANPYEILAHFSQFLEEREYPMPERAEDAFFYDLTGTWMDADGQALEQMDFQLVGNLTDTVYMNDDLERNLTFLWPEDFGYENAEPVSKSITLTKQEDGPNYHGVGLLRNTQTDELTTFSFNIFPDDEVVILEMDGKYLVSSTRSGLDAAATLDAYMDRLHSYTTQAVNWKMTAFMLNADGTVIDTDSITIKGYIRDYNEMYSYLVLDIQFPEGFRFLNSIPGPYGDIGCFVLTDDPHDYDFGGSCYDSVKNAFTPCRMVINTEKEYFVGNWEEGNVRYLVAATDPNVTADEIMDHFRAYLDKYGYNN